MFDAIVTLVWPLDAGSEETCEVFAQVESVGQREFFAAAETGLKPEYKVSVWAEEYTGQPVVIVGGKRYSVYRTYLRTDGKIELYLSEKAGVRGGKEQYQH